MLSNELLGERMPFGSLLKMVVVLHGSFDLEKNATLNSEVSSI